MSNQYLQGRLKLTPNMLNKISHLRTDTVTLNDYLSEPSARCLLFHEQRFLTQNGGLLTVELTSLETLSTQGEPLFLGLNQLDGLERPVFAQQLAELPEDTEHEPSSLRKLAAELDPEYGGLLATAQGLLNWHEQHPYCSACGSETRVAQGGNSRVCLSPDCQKEHFPRIDPAMIVLITHGEKCLLARNIAWPEGRFSCLAGFVEVGESLEDAVRREVYEEVGLKVDSVMYQGSQPWPFPRSLMLGFYAESQSTECTFHDKEIAEARWFTTDSLEAAVNDGSLLVSSSISISYELINHWYQDKIGRSLDSLLTK